MKKILIFIMSIAAVISISCKGNYNNETASVEAAEIQPAQTKITLSSDLVGKGFTLTNIYADKNITLLFADTNLVSGFAGVNRFNTTFNAENGKITFTEAVTTRMAGPEEDMKIEAEYLNMLKNADTVSLDNDVLTIKTSDGKDWIFQYSGPAEVVIQ